MKFKKEFLREVIEDAIEDKIVDNSRWSIIHEAIFQHEGKFYLTSYSVGATEQQDEQPYEYDKDKIECQEVVLVEKVVKVYEPVK
jgi:hypothetical protein